MYFLCNLIVLFYHWKYQFNCSPSPSLWESKDMDVFEYLAGKFTMYLVHVIYCLFLPSLSTGESQHMDVLGDLGNFTTSKYQNSPPSLPASGNSKNGTSDMVVWKIYQSHIPLHVPFIPSPPPHMGTFMTDLWSLCRFHAKNCWLNLDINTVSISLF